MSRSKSRLLALSGMAALLAACASQGGQSSEDIDAAISAARADTLPATPEEIEAASRTDPLTRANFWSNEYEKNPANLDTAIAFTRALREIGSHDRAIDIATRSAVLHPESDALLLVLGQSLLSLGKDAQAVEALTRTHVINPANADAYAAKGLALDRQERHLDAQRAYARALELAPDRVATRSNYAMSLALSGDLNGAESALRQAYETSGRNDTRIRENLALVLGLQGRFDEMRALSEHNAPTATAASNEALLRRMVSPGRTWDSLGGADYANLIEDSAEAAEAEPPAVAQDEHPAEPSAPIGLRGSLSE